MKVIHVALVMVFLMGTLSVELFSQSFAADVLSLNKNDPQYWLRRTKIRDASVDQQRENFRKVRQLVPEGSAGAQNPEIRRLFLEAMDSYDFYLRREAALYFLKVGDTSPDVVSKAAQSLFYNMTEQANVERLLAKTERDAIVEKALHAMREDMMTILGSARGVDPVSQKKIVEFVIHESQQAQMIPKGHLLRSVKNAISKDSEAFGSLRAYLEKARYVPVPDFPKSQLAPGFKENMDNYMKAMEANRTVEWAVEVFRTIDPEARLPAHLAGGAPLVPVRKAPELSVVKGSGSGSQVGHTANRDLKIVPQKGDSVPPSKNPLQFLKRCLSGFLGKRMSE